MCDAETSCGKACICDVGISCAMSWVAAGSLAEGIGGMEGLFCV